MDVRTRRACRRQDGMHGLYVVMVLLCAGGCVEIRAPDPAVRYIAFGNSTTKGPSTRDYPDILRERLGEAPETFANEGTGGETTEEGVERLNALLSLGLFPNAEVLLWWEGGNDILEFIEDHDPFLVLSPDDPGYLFGGALSRQLGETQDHIESAIAAARGAGLTVYVSTYFFIREDIADCDALPIRLPGQAENANAYIVRLNERIRQAAASGGAILVDVAAQDDAIRSDPANYHNCNHLSEQGNQIVAELFFEAMTGAGG